MKNILILLSHPSLEHSRINQALIETAQAIEGVKIHDLYEAYPDFNIDVIYEQELIFGYEIVIWQHPLYWYSCPPLMKQWIDLVLEYNWAYGPNAFALKGKTIFNAITAGGPRMVYNAQGRNHYTINEFMRPFEQTAELCGMKYLPPFAAMGTHKMTKEGIDNIGQQYKRLLEGLQTGEVNWNGSTNDFLLNDLDILKTIQS